MARKRPPNRRNSRTREFVHDGVTIILDEGFYPDGTRCEIFANAMPANSMIDALLSDAAIILSFALQYGASIEEIAPALKRDRFGLASSHIGAAVDRLTEAKP
ncbi:MAG: hypothetical protein EKK33_09020 [Bradyrhizobiaceae bacterium]|nr:MAG: hypothetical protein EKK33_09020 [Bradyrhizobiaceae bacterium]